MAWAAIEPGSGMLTIGAPPTEHALAKQIPGCNYADGDQLWRVPLTWPAYVAMRTVWGTFPLEESPELSFWGANAWNDTQIAYGLRTAMDATGKVWEDICEIEHDEMMTGPNGASLRAYQRGGVAWLVLQKRAVLCDPQGNGKTAQAIRALQVLRMRGEDGPALVVCADAMLYGWEREIAKWAPELSVRVVAGSAAKRRDALTLGEPADVYVISWPVVRLHTRLAAYPGQRFVRCPKHGGGDERVTAGRCEVHEKELNDIKWLAVIADEAHRMRDARAKQTRAVWALARSAEYFWPMTGTPVADHVGDFWPVGHAIDSRAFPSRSKYLDMYAMTELAWHKGTEILGLRPEHEASFHAVVQPLIRRIPKELARPEMPPRLPVAFRYPELNTGQARVYKQLRKELLADLGPQGTMVPANSAVRFGRLCQLSYASLDLGEGEDAQGFTTQTVEPTLPSSKADDLMDFLGDEDDDASLVVYCNSPRLVDLCERKLDDAKITHCRITGGMTAAEKTQSERWFQDRQCQVIFLTAAGGESITLTASDTVLFLQPNPSALATEQIIGRIDRIGQDNPVRVVYSLSVADGKPTVDHRLYQLSQEKAERAAQVTRDPELLRWIVEGEDQDAGQDARTSAG